MGRYIFGFCFGFLMACLAYQQDHQRAVDRGWIVFDSRTYQLTDVTPDIR